MPLAKAKWDAEKDPLIGTVHRFDVMVSGFGGLGSWNKVDGLGFSSQTSDRKELGINTYTTKMMGRIKWDDLKLTRAIMDDAQWQMTYAFVMRSLTSKPDATGGRRGGDLLSINVLNAWGDLVRTMNFAGARLVAWKGPVLTAGKADVATETLTFCHEGLFPSGTGEGFT